MNNLSSGKLQLVGIDGSLLIELEALRGSEDTELSQCSVAELSVSCLSGSVVTIEDGDVQEQDS